MSCGFVRHGGFRILGAVDRQVGKPGRGRSAGTTTACNETYRRNIGVTPIDADLSKLDPSALRIRLGVDQGELAVLISCAPCTGFSQKNATNHIRDDPRNQLVVRTADFVEELMPSFLVMENVKELVTGNQGHHFHSLRQRLVALGYGVSAEVHDLASFGLPQKRIRALVLAARGGKPPLMPIPRGPLATVREAIAHLPPISPGGTHSDDPMHVAPRNTRKVLRRLQAIPRDGGSWADVMNDASLTEQEKRDLLIPAMFRARPGSFPDVYGRLSWDRPAVTITRECAHVGNGRYVHPEQDRLLSVREMALLQGFPPDYYLGADLLR